MFFLCHFLSHLNEASYLQMFIDNLWNCLKNWPPQRFLFPYPRQGGGSKVFHPESVSVSVLWLQLFPNCWPQSVSTSDCGHKTVSCSVIPLVLWSQTGVRALLFFYFLFLQQSLAVSKCSRGSELLALGEQVHSITPCLAFLFLNTLGTARLWKEEVRRTEAVVRATRNSNASFRFSE